MNRLEEGSKEVVLRMRRKNKYNAKTTIVDGIKFHSQAEAIYYNQLKWLKQNKQIKDFKLQPKYILQEGFPKNGKNYRPITYTADFEVYKLNGAVEVIDIKGTITKEFAIKRKLFEYKYLYSITLLKYQNGQFVEV